MTIPRRKPRFYKGEWKDVLGAYFLKDAPGTVVARFEEKFASYVGSAHAVAVPSGRAGMELILEAMGVVPGDEVIMPAYTLKDLVRLMRDKGIIPVLADVDRGTFNIDPLKIEAKISPRTKVIMAAHIFGVPCEISGVIDIARRHGLKVVEDCAHALGAGNGGKKVGSFGDASFFSLETSKLLNTFGGGMVLTDDGGIAARVRSAVGKYPEARGAVARKIALAFAEAALIKSPLYGPAIRLLTAREEEFARVYWKFRARTGIGHFRYSDLQAFIGLAQMEMFDVKNEVRARQAALLEDLLPPSVTAQKTPEGARRAHYFYVVRTSSSRTIDKIRSDMLRKGVDCGIREEITDNCSMTTGNWAEYPVAAELYGRNIQLPMYDGMGQKDIERIAGALKEACGRQDEYNG